MIPKIIHYCWFGGSPKSKKILKCIESWKKFCPDYEIVEWNEDNFDVSDCEFASVAYNEKAWAFVSDYARLKIVYENGGIYLDTDVELIKSLDPFLQNEAYIGFESKDQVTTGLGFGAEKGNPVVKKMLDEYYEAKYRDANGNICRLVSPVVNTRALLECGLNLPDDGNIQKLKGFTVYPSDYFNPKDFYSEIMNITENTVSIHHYDASWMDFKHKFKQKRYAFFYKMWFYPWRVIRKNKFIYSFVKFFKR